MRKLAVLVLDAAAPALLRRWAADGTMPHLGRLVDGGVVAELRGVEGLFVGGTWPSFYTGLDPSRHGLYWTERVLPGTYRRQPFSESDFGRHPSLWETLGRQGRRTLVLDVPLSPLAPGPRGAQVVEWGVHDTLFGFRTSSRSLSRRVRELGPHPVRGSCDAPRRSLSEYVDFAGRLERGAALRARLTRRLMRQEEWDFLIQVFSETHCAGHQLWHFHDPDHPGYDDGSYRAAGDLVERVYRAVDRAVGEILGDLDEQTTVIVMTLHGMAHACGASFLLEPILERLAAVDPPGVGSEATSVHPGSPGADEGVLRRLYRRLPEAVRRPVYDVRQVVNQRWLSRGAPLDLDPGRVRAFHIGLGTGAPFSGIRLNLRGREPRGTLESGPEADAFIDELSRGLREIVDAADGTPLVRDLLRTTDLYGGPLVHELPDLLVEWNTEYRLGSTVLGSGRGARCRVSSPRIGTIEGTNSYCRSGEHRIEGFLVARTLRRDPLRLDRPISTLDLAPTFARALGCAMPTAQGRPAPELLVT